MKYSLKKYAPWSVNTKLAHRPKSNALSGYDDKPRWRGLKKTKRTSGRSSMKRKRLKRARTRDRIDDVIRDLLMLAPATPICESHVIAAERKLKLPRIRLRLDVAVPYSTLKGRKRRIFDHTRV